jgi:methylmalonyl-CoA mutase
VRAALDSGLVAARVAAVREARARDVATRRTPITGVSEFPDLDEEPPARRSPDLVATAGHGPRGLPVHRPSAPFEDLRDRSDAVLAATGARPRAFLATLGPLAAHAARAGFARTLLHAGGIACVDAGPTDTVDDVVAAFAAAATPVAVLCGNDAVYAERAPAVVAALRAAGARHVLLAGRPPAGTAVDGLDGSVRAGGDALAALAGVWAVLDEGEHAGAAPRRAATTEHGGGTQSVSQRVRAVPTERSEGVR